MHACCPGYGCSQCCVVWLGTIWLSCLIFAHCLCSRLDFFLVTWQWAHLRFCSLCSCVLHICITGFIVSGLAYALVLYMVVFHRFTRLRGGHLYLWATPLLALVFNRGKTTPGGGRGSRSPFDVLSFARGCPDSPHRQARPVPVLVHPPCHTADPFRLQV